ncbi:hypothetical protein K523DRAFT_320092 [Schizophyllum commune Tattone D]|nr:hypothetical protein K523DRAFT_320092 [Schizophyllum commune Tattone D]
MSSTPSTNPSLDVANASHAVANPLSICVSNSRSPLPTPPPPPAVPSTSLPLPRCLSHH